jgi:glycosyltransferase involved in cell wall biosynthesis
MKPHLVIDSHALGGSGLQRYTFEILRGLAARTDFATIHLAGAPLVLEEWKHSLRESPTPLRVIPYSVGRYSPLIPLRWKSVAAAVGGKHITWFPHWDGDWNAAPAVTTLHDLIPLSEPGFANWAKGAVARAWIRRMVEHSHALVTVSQHSGTRIGEVFPQAQSKLRVVHNGVADVFFQSGAVRPRRPAIAGVAKPYLLTVGNKRPHKRFETAIRAFARLADKQPELQLVMVGNRDPHAAALHALADGLGIGARVHDVAALADDDLAAVYANAEALLVTSREEGFGLIALEAMAAGTPVVAVDRDPFPEVLGQAAMFVPYDDDAAMAAAIQTLNEATRESLTAKGKARAAAFTWQRAADQVAELLLASNSR